MKGGAKLADWSFMLGVASLSVGLCLAIATDANEMVPALFGVSALLTASCAAGRLRERAAFARELDRLSGRCRRDMERIVDDAAFRDTYRLTRINRTSPLRRRREGG